MFTLHVSVDGGLVGGLAAVWSRGIVCGDRTPIGVSVKQKERLEVTFDTFADHIFPPGADLQQDTKERCKMHLYM